MLCHNKVVVIFHFCNSISLSNTYLKSKAMTKSEEEENSQFMNGTLFKSPHSGQGLIK